MTARKPRPFGAVGAPRAAAHQDARRLAHVVDVDEHVVFDDDGEGGVGERQRLGRPEHVLAAGIELRGRGEQRGEASSAVTR